MPDDDLTPRERRALRHRQNRRKDVPSGASRAAKRYMPLIVVGLVVVTAAAGIMWYNSSRDTGNCVTTHWHATFALYIPGEEGQPRRVDFHAPKTTSGHIYYDFTSTQRYGGAPSFSMLVHMHQDLADPNTGSARVGAAQLHMEKAGTCTGLGTIFRKLDVDISEDEMELVGGHGQVAGQGGLHEATPDKPLRWWLQTHDACGVWAWHEKSWDELRGYQIQDGESVLGALGNYTPEQVASMQAEVPPPSSRLPNENCPPATTSPTPGTTTTAATTDAETSTPTTPPASDPAGDGGATTNPPTETPSPA